MKQHTILYFLACFAVKINWSSSQLLTTFNTPRWEQNKFLNMKLENDDRLLLKPFIDSGEIAQARQLAKVKSDLFLNVTSYSGYLTVDEEKNSNLFFWFFPAHGTEHLYAGDSDYDGEDEDTDYDHPFLKKLVKRPITEDTTRSNEEKPVVLWLQGGPGSSSLFGLFTENGPFLINEDLISIKENPYSWHKNYSILFVDNPVGTGFSYTRSDGYATNVTQIAQQLYIALHQFYNMFPFLQPVEFYITGESYAGKYIPALAYEIYQENRRGKRIINLQGIVLGNAMSDPYNMNAYSDFAYQTGLVGHLGYAEMRIFETLFKTHYNTDYAKSSCYSRVATHETTTTSRVANPVTVNGLAILFWMEHMFWDATLHSFVRHSQFRNLYNIRDPNPVNLTIFRTFVEMSEIRKAIHVGNQKFSDPSTVGLHLQGDFFNSAMPWTERLLDAGLRIMYYSGNLDFIVAHPLTQNAFQLMRWKGAHKYKIAERTPFLVDGSLKGYITKVDNFIDATILNAGHMVPTDQPEACLELISRFIRNML